MSIPLRIFFTTTIDIEPEKEAYELAVKTVNLFGRDIERCGEMHEYYNPETGEGINNPGFQNWNLLVLNMIDWLENRL